MQLDDRLRVDKHDDVISAVLTLEVGHGQLGARSPHDRSHTVAVGELVVVCDRAAR